jgi:hypothetical protein
MNDDKFKQKRAHIHDRVKRMRKEEKIEEFRQYLIGGRLLKVDVDHIMADQAAVNAPDSALDDALIKLSDLAGRIYGVEPLTAQELIDALEKDQARQQPHQGLKVYGSPRSLRRMR